MEVSGVTTRSEATTAARPLDRIVGRGRIVKCSWIFQDHHFGKWPQCCPPRSEYEGEEYQYLAKDPDMVFDVEWNGHHWDCKADGYGYLRSRGEDGEYGNGSIFVRAFDGVELVTPNGEVRGASRNGEASSGEAATSTVVLGAVRPGKED